MDERCSSLRARPSTSHGSSAANLVVKLATGDVHLMQGWVQALGQHAGTIGVQVEAAFVAGDRLVHVAFVALALVVCLTDTKVNILLKLDLIWSNFDFWLHNHPLFTSLRENDNNSPLPLTTSAAHSLHEAGGVLLCVKANDEVDLTDIQPLFSDTGRHQRVEASMTKSVHHL